MAKKASLPKPDPADEKEARQAASLLKLVGDPTRIRILRLLAKDERNVGELGAALSQSQPAVSHHLALLRVAGIIDPRRAGKFNFYSLTDLGQRLAGFIEGLA